MRLATLIISSIALAGAAQAGEKSYDGTWSVRLVTEQGSCDASYMATVVVEGGQVRAVSNANGANVSGGVRPDGTVALGIQRSIARGDASGRLAARSGTGTWKVAMAGCTGRWSASRVTQTAQNASN